MTRTLAPLLFAALLGLFGIGCTRDCEDSCEDRKECVGADKSIDCAHWCEDNQNLNEKAGCEDLYDKYLSCTNDLDDICTVGDGCEPEMNKWSDCVTNYCKDHAAECEAFSAD